MAKRCGAKTRSGGKCRQWAMENGRCRMHGGATPRGPALPQYKHGMFSKALPKERLQQLRERATDPNIISNAELLALMDWRIADLTDAIENGGIPDYRALRDAAEAFRAATTQEEAGAAIEEIIRLILAGDRVEETWELIERAGEIRSRAADRERRRLVDALNALSRQEFQSFVAGLFSVVLPMIKDPDDLDEIDRFIDRVGLPHLEAAG